MTNTDFEDRFTLPPIDVDTAYEPERATLRDTLMLNPMFGLRPGADPAPLRNDPGYWERQKSAYEGSAAAGFYDFLFGPFGVKGGYDYNVEQPAPPAATQGMMGAMESIRPWTQMFDNALSVIQGEGTPTMEGRGLMAPRQDGFDPLSEENVQGYESYASWLRMAQTPEHLEAIKSEIDRKREAYALNEEYGYWYHQILAEVVNPTLLLGPAGRGAGFLVGAARIARGTAPVIAGEEVLRQQTNPEATATESAMNILVGSVFAGVLGSGFNKALDRFAEVRSDRTAAKLANEFEEEQTRLDAIIEGRDPDVAVANLRASRREDAIDTPDGPVAQSERVTRRLDETQGRDRITDDLYAEYRVGGLNFDGHRSPILVAAAWLGRRGVQLDRETFEEFAYQVAKTIRDESGLERSNPDALKNAINETVRRFLPDGENRVLQSERLSGQDELPFGSAGPLEGSAAATAREAGERAARRVSARQIKSELMPKESLRGDYRVKATQSADDVGVKGAFGMEQTLRAMPFGRLLLSGYRAMNDLALMMSGQGDTIIKRNVAGRATPQSVPARAMYWRQFIANFTADVDRLYNLYLTDGASEGREILSLRPGLAATKTGQAVRRQKERLQRAVGRTPRAQTKMDYNEFNDAIGRAFKNDRLEVDDIYKDTDAEQYILEAARSAREKLQIAAQEAYKVGYLSSAASRRARWNDLLRLSGEIQRMRNDPRLNQGTKEYLIQWQARVMAEQHQLALTQVASDDRLVAKITELRKKEAYRKHYGAFNTNEIVATIDESIETDATVFFDLMSRQSLTQKQYDYLTSIRERFERLFGRLHRGDPPDLPPIKQDPAMSTVAKYDQLNDEIIVNPDLIAEGWRNRVWTNPSVAGVRALPADAFKNASEWTDFVMRHEILHTTRKRKSGESLANYENRINDLALKELPTMTVGDYLRYASNGQNWFYSLMDNYRKQPLSQRQADFLSDMEKRAGKTLDDVAEEATDGYYWPREWRVDRILQRMDEFREILYEHYENTAAQRGLLTDPDSINERVTDTINHILGLGGDNENLVELGWRGQFSFQASRKLDIPNEMVADFIETNAVQTFRRYMDRFGPSVEMTRMFGTKDAMDAIYGATVQAGLEGAKKSQMRRMFRDAIDLREMETGDMYRRSELTWTSLMVDNLRAVATTSMLGSVAKTAIIEVARPQMANGLLRTWREGFEALSHNIDTFNKIDKELRLATSEGLESVLSSFSSKIMNEYGSGQRYHAGSTALNWAQRKSEPFQEFSKTKFHVMTLLAPITDVFKRFQNVMGATFMIEDMEKVIAGTAPAKTKQKLLSLGLSEDDMRRIVALSEKSGNLRVPNMASWGDPGLASRFTGAVGMETRRVIASGGAANRNPLMSGHIGGMPGDRKRYPVLSLPFQFLQFPIAATQKYMVAALQGRDASPWLGAVGLVGMGMLVSWLKVGSWNWDQLPLEEKVIRGVEQSGLLGIVGDLPNMLEQATGNEFGLRPLLGLPPKYPWADDYDKLSSLLGPGGDKLFDLYKLAFDPNQDQEAMARIIRRMLPLNNLIWWDKQFNEIVDPALEAGVGALGAQPGGLRF